MTYFRAWQGCLKRQASPDGLRRGRVELQATEGYKLVRRESEGRNEERSRDKEKGEWARRRIEVKD